MHEFEKTGRRGVEGRCEFFVGVVGILPFESFHGLFKTLHVAVDALLQVGQVAAPLSRRGQQDAPGAVVPLLGEEPVAGADRSGRAVADDPVEQDTLSSLDRRGAEFYFDRCHI